MKWEPQQTLSRLVNATACAHGLTVPQILGDQRNRPIVRARWEFIVQAFELGYSHSEIARFLGRDHTTIGHALKKMGYGWRDYPDIGESEAA